MITMAPSSTDGTTAKHDSNARPDSAALKMAGELLKAQQCMLAGDFAQAEVILTKGDKPHTSVSALDLLARIAIQKGEFRQAKTLWQSALKQDAGFSPAKAALARLETPWLLIAIAKRIAVLIGFAAILALTGVGIFTMAGSQVKPATPAQVAVLPMARKPVNLVTTSPVHTPDAATQTSHFARPITAPQSTTKPLIAVLPPISGCIVKTNSAEMQIIFDEGLFRYHCELQETAPTHIEAVAEALRVNASNCWILIEGHTDAIAPSGRGPYKDNYALGLARAMTVVEVLRTEYSLAGDCLMAVSAGEKHPPFAGTSEMETRKNRTVVIRLLPRIVENTNPTRGPNP